MNLLRQHKAQYPQDITIPDAVLIASGAVDMNPGGGAAALLQLRWVPAAALGTCLHLIRLHAVGLLY